MDWSDAIATCLRVYPGYTLGALLDLRLGQFWVLLRYARRHEARTYLQQINAQRAAMSEQGNDLMDMLRLQAVGEDELELHEEQEGERGWAEVRAMATLREDGLKGG